MAKSSWASTSGMNPTPARRRGRSESEAIVQALNMPGGWVDQYHVTQSTLRTHQQIATLWSIQKSRRFVPI